MWGMGDSMKEILKLSRTKIILFVVITMVIGMFGFSVNIEAKEIDYQDSTEIIDPVYNENGELIEFTVVLKNADPALLEQLYKEVEERNINLMTTQMNENGIVPLSVTGAGVD